MNTNDLKIFEAVVRHGSFAKAAESVFTVQSNVTARIKNLEEEFGAPLFSRSSRKVELTAAGEKLMKYGQRIGYLLEEAKREMREAGPFTGQLRIGCIEATMALKAPGIIKQFSESYPGIELEFVSAMRDSLIADVTNHRIDAAFVPGPIHLTDLNQVLVMQEKLEILAPAAMTTPGALLKQKRPTIIVFEQGCVFRSRLEAWLSGKGITAYKLIVLNSIEGIINFVESGLGISILPAEVLSRYYPKRKLSRFALSKELGVLTTTLVYRKDAPPSAALGAFIELYRTRSKGTKIAALS
jgi:LysR family transcriptional regulator, cell division regulator